MAKIKVSRITTEVAPPQLISVAKRRPLPKMLATIFEEEKEFRVYNESALSSPSTCGCGYLHHAALDLTRQIEKSFLLRSA